MDAARLLDFATGELRCEDCGCVVQLPCLDGCHSEAPNAGEACGSPGTRVTPYNPQSVLRFACPCSTKLTCVTMHKQPFRCIAATMRAKSRLLHSPRSGALVQQFSGGQTGDEAERRRCVLEALLAGVRLPSNTFVRELALHGQLKRALSDVPEAAGGERRQRRC